MFRIIGNRNSGKTKKLMLLAEKSNGIFVCANPQAMRTKADAYGLYGFDIISYDDYIDNNYDQKEDKLIFFDELEQFMKFVDFNFEGYTLTDED